MRQFGIGRWVSIMAVVALLASGCSKDSSAASAEEFLSEDSGVLTVDGEDTGRFGELWQQYLSARDDAMTAGSADGLDDIADDVVVEALDDEAAENKTKVDGKELDGVQEVSSQSGLVSIQKSPDEVVLRDCATHKVRLRLGEVFEMYTDREIIFSNGDDGWRISDVVVIQDGWTSVDEFGCVPADVSEEAERVGMVFQRGAVEFERDASKPLSEDMVEAMSEDMKVALEQGRSDLAALNVYSDSPAEISVVAEGLNFLFASQEGPVVRVVGCVVYPEGKVVRSVESDEVVDDSIGSGGSVAVGLDVIVREGLVGEVVNVSPSEGGC